jgi:hypothetical protein
MNIALIYDSSIRNNGTPVHFWSAFKELGVNFTRYTPKGKLPEHDFYICMDDGRDDIPWLPPRPCGYYATDTHLGWDFRFAKAKEFDIVWCAQLPAVGKMREAGINAHWMPLGCNPIAHPTREEMELRGMSVSNADFDIGFVGHLQPPDQSGRIELLDRLFREFPNFRLAFGVFHEDMARMYHQCKIGVNHAIRDDLNMRFFELASSGVPQLCDRRMVGLHDLGFFDGVHYIGYSSVDEAVEQVKRWLPRATGLEEMALMAYERVRRGHTYKHRVEKMLKQIEEFTANDLHATSVGSAHAAQ